MSKAKAEAEGAPAVRVPIDAMRTRERFASIAYHYGECETSHNPEGPTHEEMFQCGELLEHCQALRDSATGMGDPLRHPEWIRKYVRRRLDNWREPSDEWDGLVRQIAEYALREYHTGASGQPPAGPSKDSQDPA